VLKSTLSLIVEVLIILLQNGLKISNLLLVGFFSLNMLSTALSISMTGNAHRSKSYRTKPPRSRSQPPTESRYGFLPPISPQAVRPMKSFFENILHLKPHGSVTTSGAIENRTKISSGFGTTIPTDRSSHLKMGHPSVISSYSMRSTVVQSPHDTQVYSLGFDFFSSISIDIFLASTNSINIKISSSRQFNSIRNLLVRFSPEKVNLKKQKKKIKVFYLFLSFMIIETSYVQWSINPICKQMIQQTSVCLINQILKFKQ
jgi:hypothetical protein